PNLRCYVLDQELALCPIGVPGDLYVSGIGLARGYVGLAGSTADRFVPDPFASTPGSRMYCTGDIARWLPSGELEYLGRTDGQIKLRGMRVQLEEIAAAVRACPGVRDVAVVPHSSPSGDLRIVAYVVASDGLGPGALRSE